MRPEFVQALDGCLSFSCKSLTLTSTYRGLGEGGESAQGIQPQEEDEAGTGRSEGGGGQVAAEQARLPAGSKEAQIGLRLPGDRGDRPQTNEWGQQLAQPYWAQPGKLRARKPTTAIPPVK